MPSVFRFLFMVATISGLVMGGLYILATQFEPEQREVAKPLHDVKIRKQ